MHRQELAYSCGPASLRNALWVGFSHKVSEKRLRKLCGTTQADGTNEKQLCRAIDELGYDAVQYQTKVRRRAWEWLIGVVDSGSPVLLCVDEWEHWVCVVGEIGDRVLVWDPAYGTLGPVTKRGLMRRWATHPKVREDEPPYYGIAINKR